MTYLNFIPGPSKVTEEVKNDIREALDRDIVSLSHRSEEFYEIFRQARFKLKEFLEIPQNYSVYFTSSATECMEIISRNCTENRSYHFVLGAFSKRFCDISRKVGNEITAREIPFGDGFDYSREIIEKGNASELAAITYTETPTGVSLLEEELEIFRKNNPDIIIAVDIVSVAGTKKINFNLADAWFFSVQKGFGLPAGLGVLIVNEKVREKACQLREKKRDIGGFHSICDLDEAGEKDRTIETPNVLAVFLLLRQVERFLQKGMAQIEKETAEKAEFLYGWVQKRGYGLCVKNPKYRSWSVLCIEFPSGTNADDFHRKLNDKGIVIGKGYKEMKDTHFRISNFPAHTLAEMKLAIAAIDEAIDCKNT